MRFDALWLLMRKDVTLMWRDKSIFIVLLLICMPFSALLRPALIENGLLPKSALIRDKPIVATPWTIPGDVPAPATVGGAQGLPKIRVGVIGRRGVPDLTEENISVVTTSREAGIVALQNGALDLLAEFPDSLIASDEGTAPSMVRVNVIYNAANWDVDRAKIERLQLRLRSLELEHRQKLVSRVRSAREDWLLCSVQYHDLNKFVANRLSPAGSTRVGLLSGPLILAGSLIAALVMLVIVEENARHTLPLILVCAIDRRTVFLSKMALCLAPAVGVVMSMMYRFSDMIGKLHLPLSTFALLVATAGGAGLLFVFIFCSILVAAGGRSRNNVEALAKVGAPTLLAGMVMGMAYSPLAPYTPGLILFPLTNTVYLLKELLTGHPDWLTCLAVLAASAFFAVLLVRNGALAMRTEQGLSGDVSVRDPKLDSLLTFLLASCAAALLTNFIGIPASIVYPSVGSLGYVMILLVVGAGVFRFTRNSTADMDARVESASAEYAPSTKKSRGRIFFGSLCAIVLAVLTSFAFSAASPAGSASSEIARLEAVTRHATDSSLLFSLAIARSTVEELVLRGILVALLTPFFSTGVIIALMCSLGAAIHPFADTWVLMVVLSAVLTTVRIYARSVIPCVVLHVTHTVCLWLLWHRVVQ